MKAATFLTIAAVVVPFASGCASRMAPFDELDKAPITVLRLQGQEVQQPPVTTQPSAATPGLIPGLPPELAAAGQQIMQQAQQTFPGLIPPGLIPGAQPTQPVQQQPQLPRFKNFVILAQMPLTDDTVREEILDLFGAEDSFQAQRGNCFFPGMGVSISRTNAPPVDLLISLSCNQAMGDGFQWPHKTNGFTPDTAQRLTKVYEKLWGPVPQGGA